jgi:hypothetical protein
LVGNARNALNPLWWLESGMILSPARLPFHHSGTEIGELNIDNEQWFAMQERQQAAEKTHMRLGSFEFRVSCFEFQPETRDPNTRNG